MKNIKTKGMPLIVVGVLAIILLSVSAVVAIKYFQSPVSRIIVEKEITQEKTLYSSAPSVTDEAVKHSSPSVTDETVKHSSLNIDAYMGEIAAKKSSVSLDTNNKKPILNRYKTETVMKAGKEEKQQYKRSTVLAQKGVVDRSSLSQSSFKRHRIDPIQNNKSIQYNPEDDRYEVDITGSDAPESYEDSDEETISSDLNVRVSRNVVSGGLDGEKDVILKIFVDGVPPNGLILKEFVPNGWVVIESEPHYKNFNASSGQIKWLFMNSDVDSMNIRYKVKRNDVLAGDTSFHGVYMYNNPAKGPITMNIEGTNKI